MSTDKMADNRAAAAATIRKVKLGK